MIIEQICDRFKYNAEQCFKMPFADFTMFAKYIKASNIEYNRKQREAELKMRMKLRG